MRYWFLLVSISVCGCKTTDETQTKAEEFSSLVNIPFRYSSVPDIDRAAAEKKYSALKGGLREKNKQTNPESIFELMRAARLAGHPASEVTEYAQQLMAQNLDKSNSELIAKTDLETALQAITDRKLSLAEYHLDRAGKSSVANTRADVALARGVLAYLKNDHEAAAAAWNESLKLTPGQKAASINLAYLSLRTGDGGRARRLLEPHQGDWFAAAGLISAYRLTGQNQLAESTCEKVLSSEQKHAPTLVNCAIHQMQFRRDQPRANILLNRAIASTERPDLKEYAFVLKQKWGATPPTSKSN